MRRGLAPYLLLAPGLAWLALFFVVPMFYLGYTSLQSGDLFSGYTFTWAWDNYGDALSDYRTHFLRSLQYAAVATAIAFAVGYPLAYWIAFRAGRWKNVFLLLVIAPFFVTYLIRTLAWKTILADQGFVLDVLRTLQLVDEDEFSEHVAMFGYPDEVIRQARTAASWLLDSLHGEAEPFGGHFRRWLELFQHTTLETAR